MPRMPKRSKPPTDDQQEQRPPHMPTVKLLVAFLEMAQRGEIVAIGVAALAPNGVPITGWQGQDFLAQNLLLGAISKLDKSLGAEIIDAERREMARVAAESQAKAGA